MISASPRISASQCASITDALEPLNCAVIYLLGSHGGPAELPERDIDIASFSLKPVTPPEYFQVAGLLADQVGKAVDLINLSNASTVFPNEVLRDGMPLLIRDKSSHQNLEMRTLSDYARLNEDRQEVLAV